MIIIKRDDCEKDVKVCVCVCVCGRNFNLNETTMNKKKTFNLGNSLILNWLFCFFVFFVQIVIQIVQLQHTYNYHQVFVVPSMYMLTVQIV